MKILYAPFVEYDRVRSEKGETHCGDYVTDCLYHGFKTLLGDDCVESEPIDHMYRGYQYTHDYVHHGFSMFGRLDAPICDQGEILRMVVNKEFDYIISPIHHTHRNDVSFVSQGLSTLKEIGYNADQIAVICSDEGPDTNMFLAGDSRCTFFKVELTEGYKGARIYPISYSVPRDIFVDKVPEKDKDFATLIPSFLRQGHPHEQTYIYKDEETYYQDYRRSRFGLTCKKGGWDCMRHYEIIACGCAPFFTDIEACPPQTLHNYPKELCSKIKQLVGVKPALRHGNYIRETPYIGSCMDQLQTYGHYIDHAVFSRSEYLDLTNQLLAYGKKNLTTVANATYILDCLNGGVRKLEN